MVYCTRCRLCLAMRILNMVVTCFGVGMIIYSLWLLKRWREAVDELGSASVLPRPWFIYTCLGVGIIVCLSTLVGHMVANRISITALSYYILSTTSILLLQVVLIVLILFEMKWEFNFGDKFSNFLSLHLTVCRLIAITILLVQAHVLVLAVVLWALGPVSRSHCNGPSTPEFRYSFLVVGPDSRDCRKSVRLCSEKLNIGSFPAFCHTLKCLSIKRNHPMQLSSSRLMVTMIMNSPNFLFDWNDIYTIELINME